MRPSQGRACLVTGLDGWDPAWRTRTLAMKLGFRLAQSSPDREECAANGSTANNGKSLQ